MDYSLGLQAAIRRARSEALASDHIHITLEHFLLGLTYDAEVASVVKHCGGSIEGLRAALIMHLIEGCSEIIGTAPTTPQPTIDLNLALRAAQGKASRDQKVTGVHALFSILRCGEETYAAKLLSAENVTKDRVAQFCA